MRARPGKNRTMKKLAAAALVGFLAAPAAFAESTDIAAITCGDLASMPPEGISMVLTWIDGYMGGAAEDTTFDVDRLQANIDGAIAACGADANANLMEVLHKAENG